MNLTRKLPTVLSALALLLATGLAHGAPSHIYLTYSGAPETTIDINIILPRQVNDGVFVYYGEEDHGEEFAKYPHLAQAKYHPTPMELSDRRSVYVAALTGLQPGKTYHFIVDEKKYGPSKPRKFRTLPGGTAPIRFVNGGDMGQEGPVIPLLTLAGKTDPHFAIIGGDIAYVNGLLGWYNEWDMWLENWDTLMVTSEGHMIPIVAAIGNHETNRYVTDDPKLKAPWYISLFGRQAGDKMYYERKFGDNMVLLALDSGHLTPHDGAQTAWLGKALARNKDVKYKIAAYHVPLYPAHRDYEGSYSVLGRTHWGPLFDQYEVTLGLEHHDHVLKRSKPIRNGEVAESGTIYIGDGCFGREPRDIDPQPRWYNAVEASVPHFWVVDVTDQGLRFQAIDHEGATRDTFTLP
jgi:hypothetical protein